MTTLSFVRLVGGVGWDGVGVLVAVGMVEVPIYFVLRVVYQSSWKYNCFGFQSKLYFHGAHLDIIQLGIGITAVYMGNFEKELWGKQCKVFFFLLLYTHESNSSTFTFFLTFFSLYPDVMPQLLFLPHTFCPGLVTSFN